jgi:hypothetical protein
LGILAIVGLTIPQVLMTDRHRGANISAEMRAELLKNVPEQIGDWNGEDKEVSDVVRDTAGAIGAISREYRNSRTGEKVDLWLIVGHGRDISAHTPDICYRGSGFEMRAPENSTFTMSFPDQPQAPFLTNTFFKEDVTGRRLIRVFWSWYNSEAEENEGKVVWEAPTNARYHFGNTRALYKMYFTAEMSDPTETADNSPCLRFAREFMPIVNRALAAVSGDGAGDAALGQNDPADMADAGDDAAGDEESDSSEMDEPMDLFGADAAEEDASPAEAATPQE